MTDSKTKVIELKEKLRVVRKELTCDDGKERVFYHVEEGPVVDSLGAESWRRLEFIEENSDVIPEWACLALKQMFLLRAALDV